MLADHNTSMEMRVGSRLLHFRHLEQSSVGRIWRTTEKAAAVIVDQAVGTMGHGRT